MENNNYVMDELLKLPGILMVLTKIDIMYNENPGNIEISEQYQFLHKLLTKGSRNGNA